MLTAAHNVPHVVDAEVLGLDGTKVWPMVAEPADRCVLWVVSGQMASAQLDLAGHLFHGLDAAAQQLGRLVGGVDLHGAHAGCASRWASASARSLPSASVHHRAAWVAVAMSTSAANWSIKSRPILAIW